MSRGSALVSILFAFFCGIVIGNITASGSGSSDEATAAKEGEGGDTTGAVADAPKDDIERFKVPVTAAQPVKGPADALVTIVTVSDFQCPFCSRVEPTLTQIMQDYKGKVRVVWRNNPLPFHQNAMPAAELAMEAMEQGGSDKFWKAHDKLFSNQQALARENLDKYAQELGLDMTKYKAAMENHTHKAKIEADQQVATKLDARGTPAFFINGRSLSGAQPLDKFKEIIDDELKRTDKLVKSGVAKNQIYAALTKNAKAEKSADAPAAAQQPRRLPDPKAVYQVPVGNSPIKGPSDALVTIVEFSDFQCPFCSRVEPTVTQIHQTYGKDVRVIFKQNPLPFHQNAGPAAEASLEARDQGKFWEMHEKLFANQQALEKDKLEGYAKELGLNVAKFKTALETNKHKAEIDADQKLARDLGASGTPSFFINGRSLRGAQPFDAFKAVIDEEIAKAKQLVSSGTPKAQLYAKLTENGATAPKFIDAPNAPAAPSAPAEPDANKIYQVASAPKAPVKGNPSAKVVIEQFSDFQCPFCSRVEPTLKQVEEQYGSKVKIVWRNYPLPFHQNAMPAAEAATEVFNQGGNEKFWKYHELLFANQQALTRADLEKYAEQVGGINMAKFKAALDSNKNKASVQADMDAVDKAGARIGTPSFFINGKLVQGAQPFDAFKTAIDQALAAK
jgi:protein-disulfide isomerase